MVRYQRKKLSINPAWLYSLHRKKLIYDNQKRYLESFVACIGKKAKISHLEQRQMTGSKSTRTGKPVFGPNLLPRNNLLRFGGIFGRGSAMGHHHTPQAHLRRFEIPDRPGFIWMYDKLKRTFRDVKIKKAAQERGFYDPEVEAGLAEDIEKPANKTLDKVMVQGPIDNAERTSLAIYLLTMATRGRRQRRKSLEEVAPKALESTIEDVKAEIDAWLAKSPYDLRAHSMLRELQDVKDKLSKATPQNIVDLIRIPFWSERTALCVHNMVWRIAPAPPGTFFLTCDTPTHLSEWAGVGTPDSELTFPISKDLALIGSHQGPPATVEYLFPQADLVAEVNRRIVNCADRFVFSHQKEDWIAEWADNPPAFNRIQWHTVVAEANVTNGNR